MPKKARPGDAGGVSVVEAAVAKRRVELASGTVVPSLRPRRPSVPTGPPSSLRRSAPTARTGCTAIPARARAKFNVSADYMDVDDVPARGNCLYWSVSLLLGTQGMHGGTKLRMPFDAIRRRVADYVLGRIDGQGHEDPFHPDGPIQLASKMCSSKTSFRRQCMPLPPVIRKPSSSTCARRRQQGKLWGDQRLYQTAVPRPLAGLAGSVCERRP